MTKEQLREFISNEINKSKQKEENAIKTISDKRSKSIVQLNLDGSFVKEWKSAQETYHDGFKAGDIRACVRGEQKTSQGYKWMDLEEYKRLQKKTIKIINYITAKEEVNNSLPLYIYFRIKFSQKPIRCFCWFCKNYRM